MIWQDLFIKLKICLGDEAETDYATDPDVEIKRYSLSANVIDNIEDAIDSLGNNSNLPQSVSFGLFHELDNGWQITVDAVWVDYSEFGITEISVVGQEVVAPDSNSNGIYALSVGAQMLVKATITALLRSIFPSTGAEFQTPITP